MTSSLGSVDPCVSYKLQMGDVMVLMLFFVSNTNKEPIKIILSVYFRIIYIFIYDDFSMQLP